MKRKAIIIAIGLLAIFATKAAADSTTGYAYVCNGASSGRLCLQQFPNVQICAGGGIKIGTGTSTSTSSATATVAGTGTTTASATATLAYQSATATASATSTYTLTDSDASAYTRTFTWTATSASTATRTVTATSTGSSTHIKFDTITVTNTVTQALVGNGTGTGVETITLSGTVTSTSGATATGTGSATATFSFSQTMTSTATQTGSVVVATVGTGTYSSTNTTTVASTASGTKTMTATYTLSSTMTASATVTGTVTLTGTGTITGTGSGTTTVTATGTATDTATATASCANLTLNPTIINAASSMGPFTVGHIPAATGASSLGDSPASSDGTGMVVPRLKLSGASSGAVTLLPSATASTLTLDKDFVPTSSNTRDLGASSLEWANVWMHTAQVSGNVQVQGNVIVTGVVTGSNLTVAGHAAADVAAPAVQCSAGQVLTYLTGGSPATCVTNGTGAGLGCSGTCSNPSFAVFADATHITNAGYTPLAPNALNSTCTKPTFVSGQATSCASATYSDVGADAAGAAAAKTNVAILRATDSTGWSVTGLTSITGASVTWTAVAGESVDITGSAYMYAGSNATTSCLLGVSFGGATGPYGQGQPSWASGDYVSVSFTVTVLSLSSGSKTATLTAAGNGGSCSIPAATSSAAIVVKRYSP